MSGAPKSHRAAYGGTSRGAYGDQGCFDGSVMDLSVPVRHPLDPDPVRSTKAVAVLALGIVAAVTGLLVGGVIPATLALVLARQGSAEIASSGGYLTGRRRLRAGVAFAWVGIGLAATALVIAAIIGLLYMAQTSGRDYAPGVN